MGLHAPVGTRFTLWEETGTIIGVVKDFHFKSLHNPIEPLLMRIYEPRWLSFLFIRIKPENIPDTIRFIENKWSTFSPNTPFEYNFVDELLENQYTTDRRINRIIQYFTILSILIACLGVFGLASYMAEKRTKEIGIRKVLGSSISGVVLLISKEFTILVGISSMIAWPIGYFVMHRLLQNYAYRTHLNIWIFILSGLAALIITFMTVSSQSMKAATANPINSLRYE
jgi:putative ABC transport system permease protein